MIRSWIKNDGGALRPSETADQITFSSFHPSLPVLSVLGQTSLSSLVVNDELIKTFPVIRKLNYFQHESTAPKVSCAERYMQKLLG